MSPATRPADPPDPPDPAAAFWRGLEAATTAFIATGVGLNLLRHLAGVDPGADRAAVLRDLRAAAERLRDEVRILDGLAGAVPGGGDGIVRTERHDGAADVVGTGPEPLIAWRRRRGWSQSVLGERAAVAPVTVWRIERGITRPRPGVARRLAAALGTDPRSVAELADAVPRLAPERDDLAPRDDRAVAQQGADERI